MQKSLVVLLVLSALMCSFVAAYPQASGSGHPCGPPPNGVRPSGPPPSGPPPGGRGGPCGPPPSTTAATTG